MSGRVSLPTSHATSFDFDWIDVLSGGLTAPTHEHWSGGRPIIGGLLSSLPPHEWPSRERTALAGALKAPKRTATTICFLSYPRNLHRPPRTATSQTCVGPKAQANSTRTGTGARSQ